jgi:hypothetical protein
MICAALGSAIVVTVAAAGPQNPYLDPALQLYQNLEFQEALRVIDKAIAWPGNTPEQDVRAGLLEGVVCAQLGKTDRALGAFKRALAIDPGARLYFDVSPKIAQLLSRARKELGSADPGFAAAPLATLPQSPKPDASAPVVEGPPPPLPAPAPAQRTEREAPSESPSRGGDRPESAQPTSPVRVTPDLAGDLSAPSSRESAEVDGAAGAGFMAGGAGTLDVLGRSVGVEIQGGYFLPSFDLSLRVRIGSIVGLGACVAYRAPLGPISLSAGLRADGYPQAGAMGGGPVVSLSAPLNGAMGLVAGASLEFFRSAPPFRTAAVVAFAGIDYRR